MLTEIRNRSSGLFAYVIAGLIIVPMAFWGVQEYANTDANPLLVEVGDQKITQAEFQTQLSSEQQRMRQAMGDQLNNDYLSSEGFKQNVLQQMINRALLEQITADQNYRIGDQQLADAIKQSETFQVDGKFDETAYEQYVLGSQFSKTRYETALRSDNLLRQVTSGYQESALVLPNEVRELLEIQAEQRSFDLISFHQQGYLDGLFISDVEVSDYYNDKQENFMEQEKVSVDYIELDIDQIAEDIEVDDDDLLAIYEQNVESYISSEKRYTRHILLSTTSGEDDAEQLAKAENIIAELNVGKDFDELAKLHSQDPGSATNGGSLGLVERGRMVPEFEDAMFSLASGEVSKPVKTQFGYHIIRVDSIQLPEQQSFADVKFDLMQEEKERKAEEILLVRLDQMRDLAYENPESIAEVATEMGLSISTSSLFDRNTGEGIASSAQLRNAAFSDDVLVDDINSEPIEIADGQHVVIHKASYQAVEPKPLSKVREQIVELLKVQKASDAAQSAGAVVLEKALSDWQSVTSDDALTVGSYTIALIDNNRVVPTEVLQKVTTMHLKDGAPSISSTDSRNGDFHIIRLNNIAAGDVNSINEQIKDSTRRILAQRNGQSLVATYIQSLSEDYRPQINQDLL